MVEIFLLNFSSHCGGIMAGCYEYFSLSVFLRTRLLRQKAKFSSVHIRNADWTPLKLTPPIPSPVSDTYATHRFIAYSTYVLGAFFSYFGRNFISQVVLGHRLCFCEWIWVSGLLILTFFGYCFGSNFAVAAFRSFQQKLVVRNLYSLQFRENRKKESYHL